MTLESLKDKISEVKRCLDENRVIESFDLLEKISQEEGNFQASDSLKSLRQTYGYMIHYLIEGLDDPTRQDVYDSTVRSLREICDNLLIDKLSIESPSLYYSTSRICKHRNNSFDNIWHRIIEIDANIDLALAADSVPESLYVDKDNLMHQLFDIVWTERNNKELCAALTDKVNLPSTEKSLALYLISALTLSLLGVYDRDKMLSLIEIYDNALSEEIAAHSLVGIVMALRRHGKRIYSDKNVLNRLKLWQDSLVTYSRLRGVIKEIIRTRDTDRVAAKMRDEVIPELMKMRPDMLKKMRNSAMDFESGMLENNPEWEEMLEKNGLADKMRELTEMQSEGADLMMVTFSNLKGFPFFNGVSSWFMPFDMNNPAIKMDKESRKPLETVFSLGSGMCDSDKYSLVFAFSAMPEQQRKMMLGQFEQQLSQMMENASDRLEKQSNPEFNAAAVVFIRELYRFFRLFRRKEEFDDPFKDPFNFLELPVIGEMMADEEIITIIGEFYFKRGYYDEALELFKAIEDSKKDDPSYWEKVGFAHQSLKQYDKALEAYHKSELLGEPGQWLLKKLAFINKKLGNYREAAEYYSKSLSSDPDNVSLIMNTGNALSESGDLQGALHSYYHANYINPDNPKIWKAIAWTEFLAANLNKSTSYYDKILLSSPEPIDFLNAGHVKLASKKMKEAISLYKKSAENNIKDFEASFLADTDTLSNAGIDKLTQHLILDSIKLNHIQE